MFRRTTPVFAAAALFCALPANAQSNATIETVIVTGDSAHLIELQPDDTATGLALPLLDTLLQ